MIQPGEPTAISRCLETIGSEEGRQRVRDFLENGPFPRYQPHPGRCGLLVYVEDNGARTIGKFMKRRFVPSKEPVCLAAPQPEPGKGPYRLATIVQRDRIAKVQRPMPKWLKSLLSEAHTLE